MSKYTCSTIDFFKKNQKCFDSFDSLYDRLISFESFTT